MIKKSFIVEGMSCKGCASSVGSILKAQPGVRSAGVDLGAKTVLVEYLPEQITFHAMQTAVRGIGYDLLEVLKKSLHKKST